MTTSHVLNLLFELSCFFFNLFSPLFLSLQHNGNIDHDLPFVNIFLKQQHLKHEKIGMEPNFEWIRCLCFVFSQEKISTRKKNWWSRKTVPQQRVATFLCCRLSVYPSLLTKFLKENK